jgi:hypothetical protein
VYAYANWLKGQPFDVTCRVYRLDQEYPYVDDDAVEIDPAMFDDEHLIATGVYTVSETDFENGWAIMPFDLEAYNAELDMNIQVTPEIDFPIIISGLSLGSRFSSASYCWPVAAAAWYSATGIMKHRAIQQAASTSQKDWIRCIIFQCLNRSAYVLCPPPRHPSHT